MMKQWLLVKFTTKNSQKQVFQNQLLFLLAQPEELVSIHSLIDSALNKTRRSTIPNLPSSVDFDISIKYKKTNNDERYLLADRVQRRDGKVYSRILVFATDEQLKTLFNSSHITMDGTFDSSPFHFAQVYSIHAMKNDQSKSSI